VQIAGGLVAASLPLPSRKGDLMRPAFARSSPFSPHWAMMTPFRASSIADLSTLFWKIRVQPYFSVPPACWARGLNRLPANDTRASGVLKSAERSISQFLVFAVSKNFLLSGEINKKYFLVSERFKKIFDLCFHCWPRSFLL
jgi:hypothetical protein